MQIWIAQLACRNRNRSGHQGRVRCHKKNSTAWDSPQQDNSGGRRRAPGVSKVALEFINKKVLDPPIEMELVRGEGFA